MEDISYYAQRLKFIIELFKGHQSDLLAANRDKIMQLAGEYKKFENEPSYNPQLVSAIETFIL